MKYSQGMKLPVVKNLPSNAGDVRDMGLIPGSGRSPREWQPTPVFLLGESHGQRSLARYSPWSYKESDMTEATEHISEKNVKKNIYVFYS